MKPWVPLTEAQFGRITPFYEEYDESRGPLPRAATRSWHPNRGDLHPIEKAVLAHEFTREARAVMEGVLTKREQVVLVLLNGLLDGKEYTLDETARIEALVPLLLSERGLI